MIDIVQDRKTRVLVIDPPCKRIFEILKKRKPSVYKDLQKQVLKIVREPILGKPLRNIFRNQRRLHIGSFVLIYEFNDFEVRLLDFDHHDKVYRHHTMK